MWTSQVYGHHDKMARTKTHRTKREKGKAFWEAEELLYRHCCHLQLSIKNAKIAITMSIQRN